MPEPHWLRELEALADALENGDPLPVELHWMDEPGDEWLCDLLERGGDDA